MSNKLTAADVRQMLAACDRIERLTHVLRYKHLDVPGDLVYGAAGAVSNIRDPLLRASLSDVEVETTA